MSPTLTEIKEKLSTQLDAKNGVDEPAVVEVVSILENYPFTGPILEETRIGKMANDLRKRINNDQLAKRLKQLIRKWQALADQIPPVNGTPGRAVAKHLGPAVSPSPNARRVPHLAQSKGTPVTPVQGICQRAFPAVQNNRSGAVTKKRTPPCTASGNLASLRAQRQPSSALPGVCEGSLGVSLSVSGHVASPKASAQVPSPTVPHSISPKMAVEISATGGSKTASPALSKTGGQSNHPVPSPHIQSPSLHLTKQESGISKQLDLENPWSTFRCKGKGVQISSNANAGGKITPSSVHSDKTDNGRLDSDNESLCSSRTSLSHYRRPPIHPLDMTSIRELSKANVSSRKRTCTNSISPPDVKKKATDSSLSPVNQKAEKVVNGHRKSVGKRRQRPESPCVISSSSVQPVDNATLSPCLSSSAPNGHVFPPHSNVFLHQESSSPVSAKISNLPARGTLKVKTTEQLIQDLQRKNSSSILTKRHSKQRGKEEDVPNSVLPAGMKPRVTHGRKGADDVCVSVPSSDISKDELVERFLKSSDPSNSVDYSLDKLPSPSPRLDLGPYIDSCSKDSFDGNFSVSRQDQSESAPKDENSVDAVSPPLPSVPLSSANSLEEIYAQLPPINNDIDWDSVPFFELPERTHVTEEGVDRINGDRRPGVNGMYDINGDWTTWRQTITLPSYEGEPLHILPYVDIF